MMCAPFPLLATRAHSPVPSGDIMAQFLQYLPYGEIWRNQQRMGYDERYKYSGKERDEETGYDYFGARHRLMVININYKFIKTIQIQMSF